MFILMPLLLLLAGCAMPHTPSEKLLLQGKVLLKTETLWQGEILVDGEVTVAHGVTLTIAPGTNVRFVRRDKDRDGLGDATIIVKGSLVATGTEQLPIRFLSAESNPQPADWLEIRSDFAKQLLFDWCEFRDSAYTLHAHFSRGHIRNSYIHHNIDGCRLGRSRFLVQHNLVEYNRGKGINFRDSEVTLVDNIIRNNGAGIFLFEKPGKSVISRNNIYHNGLNLQLGDFFAENISVSDNWWGSSDPQMIENVIYDHIDDPELGRVTIRPRSTWLFGAGVQHSAQLQFIWKVPTDGFVDSSPVSVDGKIYFASWDGGLRAVDASGSVLWSAESGDVIDGGLLVDDDQLYFQNWSRKLFQVHLTDGLIRQVYEYPGSPADDHRQAGLGMTDKLILLPAWNGMLFAFDRQTLIKKWQYDAGMPLRAAPLVHSGMIFQGSGNNVLHVLNSDGSLLWKRSFTSPLLTTTSLELDNLFILEKSGVLTALGPRGDLLWRLTLGETCFYSAPLISGHAVYVVTAVGTLWKIDTASGEVIWKRSLGAPVYASPVLSTAGLLVGDNSGNLHLIESDSGRILATFQTGGPIQSRVLVAGNRLYFGSRDQNLYAIRLIKGGDSASD
ncbi:PQQ-binding-like beta-propeller repeat protein [Geopsychrobacter electrodiphilus]|uniref:outer membrane protein assembly factor BamB family protein n=1 Tax=Geopsychrobacter electrodiphilus TaxID=225196 RepID=UPI000360301D|nr:PQQ-binding-like beta-propeller repeat protein [Geopsychrobacter electrodiphilus]